MKTNLLLLILLILLFSNNTSAQENYKPGQPIKGAVIKMGRNPGGDIATQNKKPRKPPTDDYNPWVLDEETMALQPDDGEQAGGSRKYYVGHVTLLKKNSESYKSKIIEKTGHVTLLKRNGTEEDIDSKKYYVGHVTLLKRNGTEEEVDLKRYYVGHVTLLKRNGDDNNGNRKGKDYVGHVTLQKRNPDDPGLNERDYYVGHVTLQKKNGESDNSKIVDKTGHVTLLKRNGDDSQANGRYSPDNSKTAGIKNTREWSDDQTFKRPPVWIFADGGAILPNADAKQWLGLKEGYQFNFGAAIPINQRFGFSIQGSYSGNASNNTPAPVSTIKYMNNGNIVTLNNNQQQKATMSSFNIMAGPTIFKNLGPKFYIQPSILFGYNQFNYTGMSSGDVASFNGNSMPITLNQTNNQSSGQFAIRPDLKFGILLSQKFAIQASADYTILPKIVFTNTTFLPNGNPDPQGWYDFQQLKTGSYVNNTKTINPSYLHLSLGITFSLGSKEVKPYRDNDDRVGLN